MKKVSSILVLFFFVYFIYEVSSQQLKCWHCNSISDPYCKDPFDNRTATPKDCHTEEAPPHLKGIPATMCRKIRMKIYGEWRYKRDCARLGEPGLGGDERYCIFRSGTYNIHMEYCTCNDKENCNNAPGIGSSRWYWVATVAVLSTAVSLLNTRCLLRMC